MSTARHIKNYLKFFGYSEVDFVSCEVCGAKAVDFHHLTPRSHFGSKKKVQQDQADNVMALCRQHHEKAHSDREFNESLRLIHRKKLLGAPGNVIVERYV